MSDLTNSRIDGIFSRTGFSMFRDVEYEILGVPLEFVPEATLESLAEVLVRVARTCGRLDLNLLDLPDVLEGRMSLSEWHDMWLSRCIDREQYASLIRALFRATIGSVDWVKVKQHAQEALDFQGLGISSSMAERVRLPKHPPTDDPTLVRILAVSLCLAHLYRRKNLSYSNSWCRRGDVGVFHNMARKWDRLERIVEEGSDGYDLRESVVADTSEGGLMEQLADLTNYGLMWMSSLPLDRKKVSCAESWAASNSIPWNEYLQTADKLAREVVSLEQNRATDN